MFQCYAGRMSTITNEQIAMIQASVYLASKKRVSAQDVMTNYETCLTILTAPPWSPSQLNTGDDSAS